MSETFEPMENFQRNKEAQRTGSVLPSENFQRNKGLARMERKAEQEALMTQVVDLLGQLDSYRVEDSHKNKKLENVVKIFRNLLTNLDNIHGKKQVAITWNMNVAFLRGLGASNGLQQFINFPTLDRTTNHFVPFVVRTAKVAPAMRHNPLTGDDRPTSEPGVALRLTRHRVIVVDDVIQFLALLQTGFGESYITTTKNERDESLWCAIQDRSKWYTLMLVFFIEGKRYEIKASNMSIIHALVPQGKQYPRVPSNLTTGSRFENIHKFSTLVRTQMTFMLRGNQSMRVISCIRNGCSNETGFIHNITSDSGKRAICPALSCRTQICIDCNSNFHNEAPCEGMTPEMAEFWSREMKACPRCNLAVTKDENCNHVTCVCGQDYCWGCGSIFPRGDPYHPPNEECPGHW